MIGRYGTCVWTVEPEQGGEGRNDGNRELATQKESLENIQPNDEANHCLLCSTIDQYWMPIIRTMVSTTSQEKRKERSSLP